MKQIMAIQSFPTSRIISAFQNAMDEGKIEDYTRILKLEEYSNTFPPILGYETEITRDMLGWYFLSGSDEEPREIKEQHLGWSAWVVTDGHHRTISFRNAGLDFIDVMPDRGCLTTEEELKEFDQNF